MTTSVILAVEDMLSEVIARRILDHFGICVAQAIGHSGFGYLKKKAEALNKTALGFPVFMLTDLDSPNRCPVEILESWVSAPRNPGYLRTAMPSPILQELELRTYRAIRMPLVIPNSAS